MSTPGSRIPSPHLPPPLTIPSHVPHLLARSLTPPSKLWVSGKGALEGAPQTHRERPAPVNGPAPAASGRVQAPTPAPSTTWFWRPIRPQRSCSGALSELARLRLGSAAPPKGSFLSHLPGPRGVRPDSSPAPHGASFKLTPQGPPQPPLPWTGFSRAPPLLSDVNTDHLHCMRTRTRSAFRVPFRRFRGQPGEAPTTGCLLLLQESPRLCGYNAPQAVLFLYVRHLAQASPGHSRGAPRARLPGGSRGGSGFPSLRLGFGLRGKAWRALGAGQAFISSQQRGQGPMLGWR